MSQPPILFGREIRTAADRASADRAAALGKVNDELSTRLMHEPSGLFTVSELMWLMQFVQKYRITDNETFERQTNESLRTLAGKVVARSPKAST